MKRMLLASAVVAFTASAVDSAHAQSPSSTPKNDAAWCAQSVQTGLLCLMGAMAAYALVDGAVNGWSSDDTSSSNRSKSRSDEEAERRRALSGGGGGHSGGSSGSSHAARPSYPDHSADFGCAWGSHKYGTCK